MRIETYKKLMFMAGASMAWGEGYTANLDEIQVASVANSFEVWSPSLEDPGCVLTLRFCDGGYCDYDAVCVIVLEVAGNEKSDSELQEFVFDGERNVSIWQPVKDWC
jgi:hypothetical protein